MRRALAIAAACAAVLAGCGGDDPAQGPAPDAVADEVRAMFRDYTTSMGRADFSRACTHLTPASVAALHAEAAKQVPGIAKDCPGLMARLYRADAGRPRRDLAELARTVRVTGVDATEGADVVILSWTAEVRGRAVAICQPVARSGGEWQLVAEPQLTG